MIETSPGSKRRFYTNALAAFRGARGEFPALRFSLTPRGVRRCGVLLQSGAFKTGSRWRRV